MIYKIMEDDKNSEIISLSKFLKTLVWFLAILDVAIWFLILSPAPAASALYFLNVGQGDSELVMTSQGAKILIDGGPLSGNLGGNLSQILPLNDRYIDLIMISHPQVDHFGGLIDVLKNYEVGAVLTNGQDNKTAEWQALENIIKEKGIKEIVLSAGDKVKSDDFNFDILWPALSAKTNDQNEFSLIALLSMDGVKALFAADANTKLEQILVAKYNLDADILKVSHHGSKYSSDAGFLKQVSPAVSVIEVGKNSYGHPTAQALNRLANVDSQIFRTDKNGIVKAVVENGKLNIYTQR